MPNRLIDATSPYLLQHADNPVDWYEWGPEAFAASAAQDRPVLLSVGYSACHWCHVMAHESFEDDATAAYMNEHFVNVKVDREERPDVDRIYMDAVQTMTGQGGWPMTVFLTPAGKPFFAGTYFPKEDQGHHPSFRRVLAAMNDAWTTRRSDIDEQAAQLTEAVNREIPRSEGLPDEATLAAAYEALQGSFDRRHGGFGGAPKFPQSPTLEFLLRIAGDDRFPEAAPMLDETLLAMAAGGIYDHLGGGFARYTVDGHWLVPHFEKMLYDNALLARLYLRAWQVSGEARFRAVAVATLEYLLEDLAQPDGGFSSAEDADSEGEEGKFYVFGHDEFHEIVGAGDGAIAADYFGVTQEGNFEGRNILHEAAPIEVVADRHATGRAEAEAAVDRARAALAAVRSTRVRPGLDDKVVTAWNGLALRAFAEAGAVLGSPRYLEAAEKNARFILSELRRPDGRLLRSWRAGRAAVPGFCEDYAAYAVGLFALFQATGDVRWYREASTLTRQLLELFGDGEGGLYATAFDADELIARPRDVMDNPAPSGTSLAAEAIHILATYTGEEDLHEALHGVLRQSGVLAEQYPQAVGHMLAVVATWLSGVKEVAIIGPPGADATRALSDIVWERYRQDCLVAADPGDGSVAASVPLLEGRTPYDGPSLAYVCRHFTCDAPTDSPEKLRSLLDAR